MRHGDGSRASLSLENEAKEPSLCIQNCTSTFLESEYTETEF